jgi:hypothetical protein
MSYKCVKESFDINLDQELFSRLRCLYELTGNRDTEIDESDLIIFRLMGAQFKYSTVIFEETNPVSSLAESDVS